MQKPNQKKPNNGTGQVASVSSIRLSIYDGQEFAGYLLPIGKAGFHAYDANDHLIGVYPSLKSASAAISAKKESRDG